MGHELTVDVEHERVQVTAAGNMNVDAFIHMFQLIIEHPEFIPGMGILCDMTKATPVGLRFSSLRRLHQFNIDTRPQRGDSPVAVVVSSNMGYGLTNMAAALGSSDNFEIRAFKETDRALEWLAARKQ